MSVKPHKPGQVLGDKKHEFIHSFIHSSIHSFMSSIMLGTKDIVIYNAHTIPSLMEHTIQQQKQQFLSDLKKSRVLLGCVFRET